MLLKLTDGGDRIAFNLLKVMNYAQVENSAIVINVDDAAIEKAASYLSNEEFGENEVPECGYFISDEILIYNTHPQFQELMDWLA